MKNLHIIKVKYLGPTDAQGTRVRMTSERFQESKTISYDYGKSNITEMAEEYLTGIGHKIIAQGEGPNCMYVVSETFNSIK